MDRTARTQPARPAALVLTCAIGLVGWGFLAVATHVPGFGTDATPRPDALSFVLFLIVIVAARAMATRLLPDAAVALDSGFYVAAAVSLGSVTAGRLVALALTVDAVSRMAAWNQQPAPGPRTRWPDALAFVLYFGGMTGALLTVSSWLFGVDSLAPRGGASELAVLGVVIGTGAVFLAAHYALQGARLWWLGNPVRTYLVRLAVPALLAEAALLPLAAIIVFLYDPERPLKFILVGVTYLLINYAFHRLSSTSGALRQRVSELETLNIMAHRLASSLQTPELVETVARETMAAIPESEIVTLIHQPDGEDGLVVDLFERGGRGVRLPGDEEGEGLPARVMVENRPLHLPDLDRAPRPLGAGVRAGVRSWLGVPLETYGTVEGVLAVQSRAPHAFAPERVRLLEAIAAQAAVALQNARLYGMATVDGLTGLFVRRYFDARLDEEIQRSRRFGSDFSIVLMDIDDFKQLNDTHGHTMGDRLLRGIGETVRRQMRAADTAARYGGEEFAMILPRTSMVDAHRQAERIRREIAEFRLDADGEALRVTASFGIAAHPDGGAGDAEALIRLADRALYRAKRAGKNRVELYWRDDAAASRSSLRRV
jgi:diguanylate cyclase (GGDEF)-like protein